MKVHVVVFQVTTTFSDVVGYLGLGGPFPIGPHGLYLLSCSLPDTCGKNHRNHENVVVRNTGQGEAQHRKYKRLKLSGNQAYDRSQLLFYP